MALTTVRGRYGTWATVSGEAEPVFTPYVGMRVTFSPAYPFVTNTTAIPSPVVVATAPRTFQTDIQGYLSNIESINSGTGIGADRNCMIVSSDDPDIYPRDWKYLVTFQGPGAVHFRSFRTPAPAGATVDMAIITPQRVAAGSTPSSAEIAAANAAASAAAAAQSLADMHRGQAGGVAALDADGDVNDADGTKILAGGGGGGPAALADITGMSTLGKQLVATLISGSAATQTLMRGVIGAGTGNSNLAIGVVTGTAPDAALTNTAIGLRALDTAVMHRTSDESVSGVKAFAVPPTSAQDADAADELVRKSQLDNAVSGIGGGGGGGSYGTVITDFLDSLTQSEARIAIAAGTSSVAIGTTAGTAADAVAVSTALGLKANDNAVVKLTGAQTKVGILTLSDAPVLPAASLPVSTLSNIITYLATTWGELPTIWINLTTGIWPARTTLTGYTGPMRWDSTGYEDAVAPTAMLDGDRWRRILPVA